MKMSVYCAFAVLLGACASAPEAEETSEQAASVAETSSAITQGAAATVTITNDWGSGYCATVSVRNNQSIAISSWKSVINLNGAVLQGAPTNVGSSSTSGSLLTLNSASYNGAIAAYSSISPASSNPQFCANGTPRPTVSSTSGYYCGTVYRDADGDGYGTTATTQYSCGATPSGYVKTAGDCCDSDNRARPGQTSAYTTANNCGSFDYNCDGAASPVSNGATGCYEGTITCSVSGNQCIQDNSQLPAGCNGAVSYNTAACGASWYVSARGCATASGGGGIQCVGWSNGGPGGTQACK